MSELKIRNIDFRFDNDIPFLFNPHNLLCSNWVNALSVFAPYFEGYVIWAVRNGLHLIEDENLKEEAELFCKQEALHSAHHRRHLKFLVEKHPELDATRQQLSKYFKQLRETQSDDYHMAYAATTEIFIGPAVKFFIENHEALFGGSDSRIASLALWHFVEEFEHRNSALEAYNASVGSRIYRLRKFPHILNRFTSAIMIAYRGVVQAVTEEDLVLAKEAVESSGYTPPTIPIPVVLVWFAKMVRTVSPFYAPEKLVTPSWAEQWFVDEAQGVDMAVYYPKPSK